MPSDFSGMVQALGGNSRQRRKVIRSLMRCGFFGSCGECMNCRKQMADKIAKWGKAE